MVFQRERLYGLYAFSFFLIFFVVSYLSLGDVLMPDDHLFHIRFVSSFLEKGPEIFINFQSIYFSEVVAEHKHLIYYNFLFYLALLPFSLLTPLILGIKLYGVMAVALSLTIVYVFLRGVFVKNAFFWTLLFLIVLAHSGLLTRFLVARPFTLAPVFLVLMLYCIYYKRHRASMFIAFFYFYWHTATFFFPVCLAAAYFVLDRFFSRNTRPDWRMFTAPLFGMVVAVALSYLAFPGVIGYLANTTVPVFMDAAFPGGEGVAEGEEVYGKDFFLLFSSTFPLAGTLLIFSIYELSRYIRMRKNANDVRKDIEVSLEPLRATLFIASMVLLPASLLSSRFIDYFVYFCILYVAIACSDFLKNQVVQDIISRKALKAGSVIVMVIFLASVKPELHKHTGYPSVSYLVAQAPTEWLSAHLKPGTVIFNTDWDAFPMLYYFTGDTFSYTTGLEPRFLYDYDQRLYWLWRNIGDAGVFCEMRDCSEILEQRESMVVSKNKRAQWFEVEGNRIADAIVHDFETDTIITRVDRKDFIEVMDHSSRFKREYTAEQDGLFSIYRIVESPSSE